MPRLFAVRKDKRVYSQVELPTPECAANQAPRHTVILPVPAKPNRAVLMAVEYAISISQDVIAVHVRTGEQEREELLASWTKIVDGVPLIVLDSPNRSVLRPLLRFIDEIRALRPSDKLTVALPWLVPSRWWQRLFHNWIGAALRNELRSHPGIVVTAVPFYLCEIRKRVQSEL